MKRWLKAVRPDQAEALAIEQIEKLGGELLTDWAEQKQRQALEQSQKGYTGIMLKTDRQLQSHILSSLDSLDS